MILDHAVWTVVLDLVEEAGAVSWMAVAAFEIAFTTECYFNIFWTNIVVPGVVAYLMKTVLGHYAGIAYVTI
jgi:hypothetical protein